MATSGITFERAVNFLKQQGIIRKEACLLPKISRATRTGYIVFFKEDVTGKVQAFEVNSENGVITFTHRICEEKQRELIYANKIPIGVTGGVLLEFYKKKRKQKKRHPYKI
jgi:hypothetical protein